MTTARSAKPCGDASHCCGSLVLHLASSTPCTPCTCLPKSWTDPSSCLRSMKANVSCSLAPSWNRTSAGTSEALTRKRLHQPVFRAQVLRAYETRCAVCALHHSQLLDAAHITQDRAPSGLPLVSNGLSLCKIHHAAYDGNILGIRPDYVVEVRQAVLIETDGPMLRHGIQALHMQKLRCLPKARRDRPDPERLDERWERFRLAG